MQCISCDDRVTLSAERTTDGLPFRLCGICAGRWIRASDYQRWVGRSPDEVTEEKRGDAAPEDDSDRRGFRRCPEDEYMLTRTRLSTPQAFSIERCRHCSGMWFDRDEWEAIEQAGLARELPVSLPDDWENQLKARQDLR